MYWFVYYKPNTDQYRPHGKIYLGMYWFVYVCNGMYSVVYVCHGMYAVVCVLMCIDVY